MPFQTRVLIGVTLAFAFAAPALGDVLVADQSRIPPVRRAPGSAAAEQQAPAKLALSVGGKSYDVSQSARCVHAARASMYNKPGEYWTVELPTAGNGLRSAVVTAWRFTDKTQAFSLAVTADRDYRVSTMTGAAEGGTGTVTVTPQGDGGRFTIDAMTRQGMAIKGTIECERFAAAVAAGG